MNRTFENDVHLHEAYNKPLYSFFSFYLLKGLWQIYPFLFYVLWCSLITTVGFADKRHMSTTLILGLSEIIHFKKLNKHLHVLSSVNGKLFIDLLF